MRLAQGHFYGCEACAKNEAFTLLEEVLERCRLSKSEIRRLDGNVPCPGCEQYLTLLDAVVDYSPEELRESRRLLVGLKKYLPQLESLKGFVQQFPTLGLLHPLGQTILDAVKKAKIEELEPRVWYRGDGRKHISSGEQFLGSDPIRP